ncbi:MAG: YfiR family protein [Betaproteobacteria bacterium]|nr:YfiR family protein [Betaproteobacteria bacterium]
MRFLACIFSVLLGLLFALPVMAMEQDEAAVKAAFVYNFTKFVEWPPEASGPLQFCLLGKTDPLLTALMKLEGKQSQGQNIQVRSVDRDAGSLVGCRVIVVGASEAGGIAAILNNAQQQPVLTVSEIDHFVDAGGMIGLVVNNAKVQFEIDAQAAQRANLKLSAQLLKLAQKVKK